MSNFDGELVDITNEAFWTVSSYKPGYSRDGFIDSNEETFWQSTGPKPHVIEARFDSIISIKMVSMYLNVDLDNSYTPEKLMIQAGTCYEDLVNVINVSLNEPRGNVNIFLGDETNQVVEAQLLRIWILDNNQGGNDSHLRKLAVFGPSEKSIFLQNTKPQTENSSYIRESHKRSKGVDMFNHFR
ncbi:hypothetical protein BB559_004358 [Furculomyces boomerangus]|uniref:Anaphase-promoting complex subunit 10 n=2 Tax=Harpellales TaxID=61421 RepID=A0A2T9YF55_9FUNG|nr:hypothetical protein BB559_004358 [Furculomyces boomerangus]PVZ99886.1 hypothetical protein BB558_004083 [Smittium angustum]